MSAAAGAALWLMLATAPPDPAQGRQTIANLDAAQMLAMADRAVAAGAMAEAETIYRAVAKNDPDLTVRNEARYRLAGLLISARRHAEAATELRAILDAEPGAQRVRLELARVLALMGEEGKALRELRQAQAGDLPPDVRQVVRQVALAYRSRRPVGASFELALAPDSNINRATRAESLDTPFASLDLSEDAREQSGIGAKLGGQGYARAPLTGDIGALLRVTGEASLYGKGRFNDIALSARGGAEWKRGRLLVTPTGGRAWRWFGGSLYSITDSGGLNLRRGLGDRAAGELDATAGFASYRLNPLQSGPVYALSLGYQRALTQRSAISATLSGDRLDARDPGYATTAASLNILYSHDAGRMTLYGLATIRRLEADAAIPFFGPERRRETYWRVGGGATFRQAEVGGFAPVVRLSLERNASSIVLYDYRRIALEAGITRAF